MRFELMKVKKRWKIVSEGKMKMIESFEIQI